MKSIHYVSNIRLYKCKFFIILIIILSCDEKLEDPILKECSDISNKWQVDCFEYPNNFRQNDYTFISENEGFSVGKAGSILKFSDGGALWKILHDRNSKNRITESNLTNVFFVNSTTGFIGGQRLKIDISDEFNKGALILKTIDGGNSWTKKYFPQLDEFEDLIFFNILDGASLVTDTVNYKIHLFLTNDGGESWIENEMPDMNIISDYFSSYNQQIYLLVEDANFKRHLAISLNNGYDWAMKSLPQAEHCNRLIVVNDNTLYLLCGLPFDSQQVYKSINQGNIWQIMTNNPINNASIVHFITENEGIIINSVYELIQNGNEPIEQLKHFEVSETYNGWLDWSVSLIKPGCHLDGLEYNIAHHKFAIMGDKFCILTLK